MRRLFTGTLVCAVVIVGSSALGACSSKKDSSTNTSTKNTGSVVTTASSLAKDAAGTMITTSAPAGTVASEAPKEKINLNTGTREEFLSIPGMNERLVKEFFEYRPYTSMEQFRKELGKYLSDEDVAALEAHLTL